MSRLSLFLLGPPRLELDDEPIKLDRRKAVALLAYLALSDRAQRCDAHPRDSLVNLLWPDYDSTRGRAALRRTLFSLRQAVGEGILAVDRDEIGLDPAADVWVDVLQFRQYLADCEAHGHPPTGLCPACVQSLTQAVELASGDFLSGFGLPDSLGFDDWQLLQTEALRRGLAGALDRLVKWHSTQCGFEPALAHARRRLALDPLDEHAHRSLMRLYAWSGRRPAALRQYEDCAAILEDQLGVSPQEATTDLYLAILAGRPPALPPRPSTPYETAGQPTPAPAFLEGPSCPERPVFVARERELALLGGFLEGTLKGRAPVVFITGDAGSGKTALVQEFAWRAQDARADLIVAAGLCSAYTGTGDPYLPFREILTLLTGDVQARWAAGAISREHARRLWNLLPIAAQALFEAGPDLLDVFVQRGPLLERASSYGHWPNLEDSLSRLDEQSRRGAGGPAISGPRQSDLFEQVTRMLQTVARNVPLLLVLDDLQWADLGSIGLLFHLGRRLAGSRVLILGLYRAEEVAIGREGERHPLEPVIHELQRAFGDITVNLGQAESREFVDAFLDSEPNRLGLPFREMLHALTRGHPLFTVELLRGMQERGDLAQDEDGHWVEGRTLDWDTLPARVEAVVAERVHRLAEPLQATLRVASVEGETFTAEVVARVEGSGEPAVLQRLSGELDRRHRLVRADSIQRIDGQALSSYRFRHILTQRYLYGSLDEVERVHLHERVGSALEGLYGSQPEMSPIAVQLALHYQRARITEKAIHYLHLAAKRAIDLSAFREGLAHLNQALALLATLPKAATAEQRFQRTQQELALRITVGVAWKSRVPDPEGEEAVRRARELCQQTGSTSQLSQILGELMIFAYVRGDHQRARDVGEEALSLAQQAEDPLLVALGHWQLGFVCFALGEFLAAQAHLRSIIAFYQPQEHHRASVLLRGTDAGVSAMAYYACCLWCLGYPEQALRRSQEALALARQLNHAFSLVDVLCFAGCAFDQMRRDYQAMKEHAVELADLSDQLGSTSFSGTGNCYLGEALAKSGQIQEGLADIRAGLNMRETIGALCFRPGILAALAEVQALGGQVPEGLAILDQSMALIDASDERYFEAEAHRLRGRLLLLHGDRPGAEASYQRALEVARRQQAKSWELRAATSLARLWQEQRRSEDARRILAPVYGWFTEGFETPDLIAAAALLDELG